MPTPLKALSILNLANPRIAPQFDEPWRTAPPIPAQFKTDRDAYKKWMASPESTVPLFSLIEAENPGLRVSASNPAYRVRGIVTDYDAALTPTEVLAGLARVPIENPCYAWNITRGGGVRMVWRFEEPIFYYGADTFKAFTKIATDRLRLKSLFPNLDAELLHKPDQCYAAGDKWTVNEKAVIPVGTLHLWLHEAVKKSREPNRGDVEIPFEMLAEEVERQFPGRWSGEFTEGARGVRFWDPAADNPTAAVLRKTGVTCYTGEKPFLTWAEILGKPFVEKFEADRIGRSIFDLWVDAKNAYWRKLEGHGNWIHQDRTDVRLHLRVTGLSDKSKGDTSEVDHALHTIQTLKRVTGVLPFPHDLRDQLTWNGLRYLNSSRCELVKPVDGPVGPEQFPWLAHYFDVLFPSEQNQTVFLTWLQHWYASCLAGRPDRGHAMFIAGPQGNGKTFLATVVLATIFGGYSNASGWFVEGSNFNGEMFNAAVWSLDDQSIAADQDRRRHREFTNLVKQIVANPSMPYNAKWGYCGQIPFNGRLVTTLNMDAASLSILPASDASLMDKIILLRTGNAIPQFKPTDGENRAVVAAELPFFLRWLLDMPRPDWLPAAERFGFKAVSDEELLEVTVATSETTEFMDAIRLFLADFTADDSLPPIGEIEQGSWVGTSTELLAGMKRHPSASAAVQHVSLKWIGMRLRSISQEHPTLVRRIKKGGLYKYALSQSLIE